MYSEEPPNSPIERGVAAAVSAALARPAKYPLLEAADLLIAACVRAARLYPEWAELVDQSSSGEIDSIAQHIVAANLHLLTEART